jgi:deazaflavin-dependent oxidoreductase (nitroreductase family)
VKTSDELLGKIRAGAARHLARYIETDGEDGYIYNGVPSLILTATGRRSGEPRSTPLIFGRDGDRFIVIASLGGSDEDPGWYRNLAANPDAHVQVKGEHFSVRARTAEAEERARLWELMVEGYPPYADYQARTERRIPVVVLEPR